MLTGEYKTTVDEKGRLMFPSKLRTELSVSLLVVTRGIDGCLWMFSPERWQAFYEAMSKRFPFSMNILVLYYDV